MTFVILHGYLFAYLHTLHCCKNSALKIFLRFTFKKLMLARSSNVANLLHFTELIMELYHTWFWFNCWNYLHLSVKLNHPLKRDVIYTCPLTQILSPHHLCFLSFQMYDKQKVWTPWPCKNNRLPGSLDDFCTNY